MPDPLFDFSGPEVFGNKPTQDRGNMFGPPAPDYSNIRPPQAESANRIPTLSQEMIDQFTSEAGLEDWERRAMEARAKFASAKTTEEAAALFEAGYKAEPDISTFEQWKAHIEFREQREKRLEANLAERMKSVKPEEAQMLRDWLAQEKDHTGSQRTKYSEAMRRAEQVVKEEQALLAEKSKGRFWDKNKDPSVQEVTDVSGTLGVYWQAFKDSVAGDATDWILDALSTPVNTISTAGYAISSEISMGLDQLIMWANDPNSEAYKTALNSYADKEKEMNDLWDRGGGFMGLLAEWVPGMDDDNSIVDLMSSQFRHDVGEGYDRLYTNIDFGTNGGLTSMDEFGAKFDVLGSSLFLPMRLPSLPRNLASSIVSAQEMLTGHEFEASERRAIEREMTKEVAGGLLEMTYDPLNVIGGGAKVGALTKASRIKHLAKVTDSAGKILAKAKALGVLDGLFAKGGKYVADVEEASEMAKLLSKQGDEFGHLGAFADTVKEQVLADAQDIQSVLSKTKANSRAADLTGVGELEGAAGKAPRGRMRIYEVSGEHFTDYEKALEYASKVKHKGLGLSGDLVQYADMTPAEWSAVQRAMAGALTGDTAEVKRIAQMAEKAMARFKVGSPDKVKPNFFTKTVNTVGGEDAARAGELFDKMMQKELTNLSNMKPSEFVEELGKLRSRFSKTTAIGKEAQKTLLKSLDEQISAARKLMAETDAPGAFLQYHDTIAQRIAAGKSQFANAAELLEKRVPGVHKLALKQFAAWTLEVGAKLGDKAVQWKLPNAIRKMIVSQVPPKWWRAKLVAETMATSDKVQARQFLRDFTEAFTKRLNKYKFTAEEVEKDVILAKKGDPILGVDRFGIPLQGGVENVTPTGQAPGKGFGLVQTATHAADEVEKIKTPAVIRHLTDEEKADIGGVIREIVERTSRESRTNPHAFLRELESSKQGRALLERMGPHFDLVLEASRHWDQGAEFMRLFQTRKGLKVSELMDDVVEGWFGRVWSEEMMSLILENPSIRAFVKNMQTRSAKQMAGFLGLSKQGQFAERSAKGMYVTQLEAMLRKRFNIPKGMEIFAKDPTQVLKSNVRLAEEQFEKLRLVQAFSDASAPLSPQRLQELVGMVREHEAAQYASFVERSAKEPEGLSTEEALTRRRLAMSSRLAEDPLVRDGGTENPIGAMKKWLLDEGRSHKGGPTFGDKVKTSGSEFLKKRLRDKISTALRGETIKDWGTFKQARATMAQHGFDLDAALETARVNGDSFEQVVDTISSEMRRIYDESVEKMDLQGIFDMGSFDPVVADYLNNEAIFPHAFASPLDTPEGRTLNIWVVEGHHKSHNPWTGELHDLNFSARGTELDKNNVLKVVSEANPLDPVRRRTRDRRGYIIVSKPKGSKGDIAFAAMHEAGHSIDNIGVIPPTMRDLFAQEYTKFMKFVRKNGEGALPQAYREMQKHIYERIYGEKFTGAKHQVALMGGLDSINDANMSSLFSKEQWQEIRKNMQSAGKYGTSEQYRLKPNEMFADTFALAMQGIYDPRLPQFSKAMMQMRQKAQAEGKSIWKAFAEIGGEAESHKAVLTKDPIAGYLGDLDGMSQADRAALLGDVAGQSSPEFRTQRDELMEAFGARRISIDKMDKGTKLKYIRNILKKAGVEPAADEMRAWDLMKKMGAKEVTDLDEMVRLNTQMIKHSDVRLMDEIFEVAKSKGKVQEGVSGLMRIMQKSVLALPSGALKDTVGSLLWYWIHARNPIKSATKAMSLLVDKGEFAKALRTGSRVWKDDPILDAMFASKAITGRTEIEMGRVADAVASPLGKVEQQGLIGSAVQAAGAPVDLLGAGIGKIGKALGLGETKPGKAVASMFERWKRRGRAVGQTTDMPIHFRKAQDEVWRVALYLDRIEAGIAPEKAVQSVFAAFGNMGELTGFEQKYLKPWFFFYTWMRKAIPRAARAFVDHPIKARMVYLATIGDVGTNEDGQWPSWLQQLGGWHIGKDASGNPAVVNVLPGSWFQPLRDITQNQIISRFETEGVQGAILGGANAMLRNAMPLWKVPVETATGIDSFTGLPISDPRGTGQKTADRAPPVLSAPWVPESVKKFFDVRPVYDKDTGDLLYYHMDPTKRHLLFKPFPGVEAGLNQLSGATLADERKTTMQQYGRVLGTPVYSIPEVRDEGRTQREARLMQRHLFKDVDALEGHPLAMAHGRVFVDETSPTGRELKENMAAFGERYLAEKTERARMVSQNMTAVLMQGKMNKLGRQLTPAEIVRIQKAAENSTMPGVGEQESIRREGELLYLGQKNPQYKFYIELSERLQYWAQDEKDRKDYKVPDLRQIRAGTAGSLQRLESIARRGE